MTHKTYKKIVFLLAAAILAVGGYYAAALNGWFGGGAAIPEDTMTRGLVGYWSMDEGAGQTAFDASGNSNNGTLGSSSSADSSDPLWTKGKNGGGLSFDGSNDYVDAGNGASLNITGAITIEMWIYDALPSQANKYIFSKGVWNGINSYVWQHDGSGLAFSYGNGSVNTRVAKYGFFGSTSQWYHIVTTIDASNVKIYKNGSLYSTDAIVGSFYGVNTANLIIGSLSPTVAWFNGSIDEVRIYNRALSAEEVRYHYNRGGPVGYWPMDEGSGTTAFDSTENNNDGTITNATWTTGKYGSALNFDGTGDYVTVPDAATLDITDAITLESWVNVEYTALVDDASTTGQFTHRKEITITTGGTSTPANYQVKVTVAYESEMQASFEDIRFNTNAGTYIDYWIESHTDSTTAEVWLELPDAITDPGSDTIWMYYGNDGLSDGGNYSDVFLSATGGSITYDGDYIIHTFINSGTFTPSFSGDAEVTAVGGGGGGSNQNCINGGGSGGNTVIKVDGEVVITANGGAGSSAGTGGYGVSATASEDNISFLVNDVVDISLGGGGGGGSYSGAGGGFGGGIGGVSCFNSGTDATSIAGGDGGIGFNFGGGTAVGGIGGSYGGGGGAAGVILSGDNAWGGGGGGGGSNGGGGGESGGWGVSGTDGSWAGGDGGDAYGTYGSGGVGGAGGGFGGTPNDGVGNYHYGGGGGGGGGSAIISYTYRFIIANEPTASIGAEVSASSQATITKDNSYSLGASATTAYAGINDQSISASMSSGWNHIALTYNKDAGGTEEMKLYINGIESATGDYSTAIAANANDVLLGNTFEGKIDEVRVYPYARSADEIRLDYQAGYATHLGPSGKTCAQDPASCMDYGLVGSWNMDEGGASTAKDSSGNGNNGALTNGPLWTKGKKGNALKFDGVNDYITSNFQFSIFNFQSIFNWINFQTLATGKPIIGKWGNSQNSLLLKTDDTNSDELKICIASGLTDNCTIYGTTTDANIAVNVWYNIQIVYDGTQSANADKLKLYLNGAQKTLSFTGTIPTTLQNSTGALEIGGDSNLAVYTNIKIDEVRIYNRALSFEEINYLYNEKKPVGQWDFDEGAGTTARDSQGSLDITFPAETNRPTWSKP